MSMVICKIWDADYPWDVRVEKVCRSLQQRHQVHLICRNTKRRATYEEHDGMYIHRLPFLPAYTGKLNAIMSFPAFFNPLWLFTIWRVVRRYKANMILVRDLPLALAAIMVARWCRIPVILDMAENYPAMIQDLWCKEFRLTNFFVRNPFLVSLVEKICIRYVDHILVVVEESQQRLMELGVSPQKLSLVTNTPPLARLSQNTQESAAIPLKRHNELMLIYLGLLEWPRGLETVILAVQQVRQKLSHIRLIILGSGRDEDYFKKLVIEMDLTDNIQFLGWIHYTEAIRYIHCSDIGLVPHHATASWNTTIPNKLFDYMSMGKPVIVSSAKPTERIVREEKCGVVFEAGNPQALAAAIMMLSEQSVREDQGKCGRDAVERKYNWSVDENRLLSAIEDTVHLGSHR